MKTYYDTQAQQHEKNMKIKDSGIQKAAKKNKVGVYSTPRGEDTHILITMFVDPFTGMETHRITPNVLNAPMVQMLYATSHTTELQRLCSEYKRDLTVSPQEAQRVEAETKQQSGDTTGLWANLRRCRLTASNFGIICKCRPTTPVASLVKSFLYKSSSVSAPSIHWGRH